VFCIHDHIVLEDKFLSSTFEFMTQFLYSWSK
jgi:GT2 family glycosyltransferase